MNNVIEFGTIYKRGSLIANQGPCKNSDIIWPSGYILAGPTLSPNLVTPGTLLDGFFGNNSIDVASTMNGGLVLAPRSGSPTIPALVANNPSGTSADIVDFQTNAVNKFTFGNTGNLLAVGTITCSAATCLGSDTATTQSQADNSTKVSTTAYVDSNTTVCNPGSFATQTDGATVTWAVASVKCANASLTFTVHSGSRTLNLTGLVTGGSYVLKLIQDATGGESLTGGTGCTWKQAGGGGSTFTLTGTAAAIDVLAFMYDGTNCLSTLTKAFN